MTTCEPCRWTFQVSLTLCTLKECVDYTRIMACGPYPGRGAAAAVARRLARRMSFEFFCANSSPTPNPEPARRRRFRHCAQLSRRARLVREPAASLAPLGGVLRASGVRAHRRAQFSKPWAGWKCLDRMMMIALRTRLHIHTLSSLHGPPIPCVVPVPTILPAPSNEDRLLHAGARFETSIAVTSRERHLFPQASARLTRVDHGELRPLAQQGSR